MPPNSPTYFTYFADFPLKTGALVEIDFRKKIIPGYVLEVKELEKSRQEIINLLPKLKKIRKIIKEKTLIRKEEIQFAQFLAGYFGFSLASVFSFFYFPAKAFLEINSQASEEKIKRNFKIFFREDLDSKILIKKRNLLIVPEISFFEEVSQFFEKLKLPYLKFSPPWNKEKIKKLAQELKERDKKTILIPKHLVFLPWKNIDQLIVFREGSFFYYDNFKKVNFDYRDLIFKLAQIKRIPLILIDRLPSLQSVKFLKLEIKLPLKIEVINDLEEILKIIKTYQKIIFFFPQKIVYGLRCELCFNSLKCPRCQSNLVFKEDKIFCLLCSREIKFDKNLCPFCQQKLELGFKRLGLISFYKFLKKNYPEETYLVLKKRKKNLKILKNKSKFFLLGSLNLLSGHLPEAEALIFFNFENFYLTSDPFLREKYLRILAFFQEKVATIFLVSNLRNLEIEKKIYQGSYFQEIIKERELLRLNPFYKIIKLIKGSSDFDKLQKQMLKISQELKNILKEAEVIGPVLAKPFRFKKRYFLEIIIRTQKEDFKLQEVLKIYQFEKIKINPLEI